MPFVEQPKQPSFSLLRPEDAPQRVSPTGAAVASAAIEQENDLYNAWQLLSRPSFPEDESYNNTAHVKASKYWDSDYRDSFIGARSEAEYNFIAGQIEQERRNRDVLSRSGWGGTVAMMSAAMLSPTLFMPFTAGGRGLKAVGEAALLAGGGAALQEIPLVANQQTRTSEEVGFSVAASTVLGAILGGAVVALRPAERAVLEDQIRAVGMAIPPNGKTISSTPGAIGSEVVNLDPGGIARGGKTIAAITDSNFITRDLVTSNVESGYVTGRIQTVLLDDGGFIYEGNAKGKPTVQGGAVIHKVTNWQGELTKWTNSHDDIFYDYRYNGAPPKGAALRTLVQDNITGTGGKMSREEFNIEVSKAAWKGDVHEDPHVQRAAQAGRKAIMEPVLKAMQEAKLLGLEIPEFVDLSYFPRLPDVTVIGARQVPFMQMLERNFNKYLQAQFQKALEKFQKRQGNDKELLEDMGRPADEIAQLRDEFGAELKAVEAERNAEQFTALKDTIDNLKAMARAIKSDRAEEIALKRQMLQDARDMETAAGPTYASAKERRAELKRRLSNLNKATSVLGERLAGKLSRIERAEELSLGTIQRVIRSGRRLLDEMDKWTDEVLDEKVAALRNEFERVANIYDKGEEQIAKSIETDDVLKVEATQEVRVDKMSTISEKLADAEDLGRPALRELLTDMLDETAKKAQGVVERRAVRTERLRKAAGELTPEKLTAKVDKLREKMAVRAEKLDEFVTTRGGRLMDETADFTSQAQTWAEQTKDKFLATNVRLPIVDMMQEERGAALPRALGWIPMEEMAPYMRLNYEEVMKAHVRTMTPDLEIAKAMGDVNNEEGFTKLRDEYNLKVKAIDVAVDSKGKPRSKEWKEKETLKEQGRHGLVKRNLEVMMNRLRHKDGLPSDPNGIGYRMGKVVADLNVLRFMGMVTVSSIPDPGRIVMRNGLTRVFRDGFLPMVTNLKGLKASAAELKAYGIGIEVETSSRANSLLDVMEDLNRGTKFERGINYASQRMGLIAGFSYWTDAMKRVAGNVSNVRMLESIATLNEGKGNVAEATNYLAQNGIEGTLAERIWAEVQKGGGQKVNGVWLPNTEDWKDAGARSAFRAAVVREVNNTIVTPGVGKPIWTTASTTGRLLAQFKSFGMASTTRTVIAGLQQRDAAAVSGTIISLALGALSYYIYASINGGDTYEKMQNAGLDDWADEAIARSGLTAVFGFAQEALSRIPATANYATFSGGRTSRRGGDNLLEVVGGPTLDFATTVTDIAAGIDDPTESTAHKLRLLTPYQNTHVIGRLYDAVGDSVQLKERRQ